MVLELGSTSLLLLRIRYVLRIHFPASNNAAEYEACLFGLRIAVELGIKRLLFYGDSALVIN